MALTQKHYSDTIGANFGMTESQDAIAGTSNFWQGSTRYATGMRHHSATGGEFVFVKFTAACAQGDVVIIDEVLNVASGAYEFLAKPMTTVLAATKVGNGVGVVYADAVAANDLGFVQVCGGADVRVPASTASNTPLLSTTTPGQVSTAGGNTIAGLTLFAAAPAAANFPVAVVGPPAVASTVVLAPATLNYPRIV
jgi:hypothetical protein